MKRFKYLHHQNLKSKVIIYKEKHTFWWKCVYIFSKKKKKTLCCSSLYCQCAFFENGKYIKIKESPMRDYKKKLGHTQVNKHSLTHNGEKVQKIMVLVLSGEPSTKTNKSTPKRTSTNMASRGGTNYKIHNFNLQNCRPTSLWISKKVGKGGWSPVDTKRRRGAENRGPKTRWPVKYEEPIIPHQGQQQQALQVNYKQLTTSKNVGIHSTEHEQRGNAAVRRDPHVKSSRSTASLRPP